MFRLSMNCEYLQLQSVSFKPEMYAVIVYSYTTVLKDLWNLNFEITTRICKDLQESMTALSFDFVLKML